MKHRGECNAMAAKWCAGLTVAEVVTVCAREGIACAPVYTCTQAARDRHVYERDMLQETIQEDGSRAPITGPAAKFSPTPVRIRSGSPAPGARNNEILAELGIDGAACDRLRSAKVI